MEDFREPELNHERLLYLLKRNTLRYKLALFSAAYTSFDLLQEPSESNSHLEAVVSPSTPPINPSDIFSIKLTALIEEINQLAIDNNRTYDDYVHRSLQFNAHLIRTGSVNYAYELIKVYANKNKVLNVTDELKNELWYAVLYIIRNNASHADNMRQYLSFSKCQWIRKKHGTSFVYDGVKITEGMSADMIKYNDRQILSLLTTSYEYIKQNLSY